ncbi:MAG: SelB C-terminal domain-containing protein, partial [Hyphomicrobiaceae bacterium]|nr:SelB C-terminal domain-containing protein [Hyphomicrobiaceae bacterium]
RPPHETAGVFRMAIDRSFTLQGTGTVVTGTILAGAIAVGERVLGLPGGIEARVRSLHAQNRQVARAEAGERCALNVAGPGVSRDALGRGDWLSIPGHGMTTARFDADVWLLTSAPRSLKTWAPVYLHVGTSAVVAHLVLLSADQLAPGQRARAQLVLPGPLPLRTGDRIVLRDSGAERTIGGGRVIDPRAPARRRRSPARLAILEALAHSEPGEALEALLALPPYVVDLTTFTADRAMTDDEAAALVAGRPLVLVDHDGARFAMSDAAVETLEKRLVAVLERFHAEAPELPGMPDEALRRNLEPAPPRPVFPAMLRAVATRGAIVAEAGRTRRASHKSALSAADDRLWQQVRSLIAAEPHRPPTAREIGLQIGQPVAQVRKLAKTMARIGEIAEVGADRFFLRSALLELGTMADELAHASPERAFTAAAFKERVGCGRNVAIQVLEYFDRHGLTVRLGDVRRMARTPTEALMRE